MRQAANRDPSKALGRDCAWGRGRSPGCDGPVKHFRLDFTLRGSSRPRAASKDQMMMSLFRTKRRTAGKAAATQIVQGSP